jgi:hypothetical protein
MHKRFIISAFCSLAFAIPIFAQENPSTPSHPCMPCENLMELKLPDVTISEAMHVSEETAHCKLLGTIGKEIGFELLLPDQWNERFVMGGGGGFVGAIQNHARGEVKNGYATAGTDTGHKGHGIKADWALNHMERQLNFGHVAVHRTAVVSKWIISHYYCSEPEYSYFIGCSRGGGQAMMEAQRYPGDFDGIVSGCPAFNWPAIAAEFTQNIRAIYPDPADLEDPVITKDNLHLLQTIILNHCDALDGLKDGILNDPRECDIDFSVFPKCPDNLSQKNCFTTDQLNAIKKVYDGVANQLGEIYPGFPPGCENEQWGWGPWIVGPHEGTRDLNFPSLQFGFGTEIFKYLVFQDPDWDYTTYDLSNFYKETRYASSYLDATSTDYTIFKERNAKMIIWHGWNDPALSALSTIEYYNAVEKVDPEVRDYLRLFLLPGVLHCGGGPGPSQVDWLEIIRKWVEDHIPPDKVIVSKIQDEEVLMTRPVFPYPKKAIYDGTGDPNDAGSFSSSE